MLYKYMTDYYGGNKLAFEYSGGNIIAGGYNIQSDALQHTIRGPSTMSGGGTNPEQCMIPIGLINLKNSTSSFNIFHSTDVLSNDLYETLLQLVSINPTEKKNISKKNSQRTNKTRKIRK